MAVRILNEAPSQGYETPAARLNDLHLCPKHGGGPVSSASPNVFVNSLKFARATDKAQCPVTDYIVTGSGTVRVNGKPAARVKSKTMHAGQITQGSSNVLVGGPDAGSTLGNPKEAEKRCKALSQSRVKGTDQQSFGNCSIESSRLLISQATGSNVSELGLLGSSVLHGDAATGVSGLSFNKNALGGTYPSQQSSILSRWGVDNTMVNQTPENITQGVADGNGLVTSHNAATLWGDSRYGMSGHAVSPTGLDYGPDGQLQSVHNVDSGQGQCDRVTPASAFMNSMSQYPQAPMTTKPIW